jgi:hypothetical protein
LTRHRQPGKAATSAAKSLMSRGRIEPPATPDSGSRSWPSKRNRSHAFGIFPSSQFSSTASLFLGPQRPVAAHLNATLVVKEAVDSLVGDACAHARKGPREGQQDCASALPANEENKGRFGFARQKTCPPTGIEPRPPATRRATRRLLTGHHPCRTGYRQIKSETGFFRKFPSLAEPMRASPMQRNATQRNTMLPDVTEIGKSGPGCVFRRFPSLTPAMPVLLVKKAVDYLESRAVER